MKTENALMGRAMSRMGQTSQIARMPRSRWMCIAYAFPPINRSGTHRTLGFVRHLDRLGWDATVLTVEPADEPIDDAALKRVPSSTTILRTPWIDLIRQIKRMCRLGPGCGDSRIPCIAGNSTIHDPSRDREGAVLPRRTTAHRSRVGTIREFVSRLLITPDSRVGWVLPAVRAGSRHIRRQRPDVLYSTSPYASAHLIALILSRRTGLPWVADLRDPWSDNPFRQPGFAVLEHWDAWLESAVLRRANHVVCNTSTMKARLCERVPFLAGRCSVIPNGFDAERFHAIEPLRHASRDTFVLTHGGQFYGRRSPRTLFGALRRLRERSPELARRMQIVLIGPRECDGQDLAALAAKAGVADQVNVLGQKSHAETLSYLVGSDALMLVGACGPGSELQVPNKLFEYLAIRKPIIAALSAHSPAGSILNSARALAFVCHPDDPIAVANAIAQLAEGRLPNVDNAWSGVDQFDRAHRAEELASVFRKLSAGYAVTAGVAW